MTSTIISPASSTVLSGTNPSSVPTSVHVVACTNKGESQVLLGYDNGKISIFSPSTLKEVVIEASSLGAIWKLASWDEHFFAAGGTEGLLKVWDLKTLNQLHDLQGHTSTIRDIQFINETTLISSSRDATIRVWDLPSQTCRSVLTGHTATIRNFAYSSITNLLVSAAYEQDARVWDLAKAQCMHVLKGHSDKVYSAFIDQDDGNIAVTGSIDGTAKVWDLKNGTNIATLQAHSLVSKIIILPEIITIADSKGHLLSYSRSKNYEFLYDIAAHENAVVALEIDMKAGLVVTGSSDGMIKVWNVVDGSLQWQFGEKCTAVWWAGWIDGKVGGALSRDGNVVFEISS